MLQLLGKCARLGEDGVLTRLRDDLIKSIEDDSALHGIQKIDHDPVSQGSPRAPALIPHQFGGIGAQANKALQQAR